MAIPSAPRSPRRHLSCPGTSAGLHQPRPADPHQRLSNPDRNPPAGCRSADGVAEAARSPRRRPACPRRRRSRQPANRPRSRPGSAASLIVRLAQTMLDLDRQLTDLDHEVVGIFRSHDDAAIITSLTGIGDVLGARSSWPSWAARWPDSPLPTTSPATQASHPRRRTPATALAACTGHSATTGNCSASSIPQP